MKAGWKERRVRKVMFAIFKSMRCLMGSQWSCWRRVGYVNCRIIDARSRPQSTAGLYPCFFFFFFFFFFFYCFSALASHSTTPGYWQINYHRLQREGGNWRHQESVRDNGIETGLDWPQLLPTFGILTATTGLTGRALSA